MGRKRERMFDAISTMAIGVFIGVMILMLYSAAIGRRVNIAHFVPVLVIILMWFSISPLLMDAYPEMAGRLSPCVQEEWVDCELYGIPLNGCEMEVNEVGPFYDVRTTTTYRIFTCTRWQNGTVLQPK